MICFENTSCLDFQGFLLEEKSYLFCKSEVENGPTVFICMYSECKGVQVLHFFLPADS